MEMNFDNYHLLIAKIRKIKSENEAKSENYFTPPINFLIKGEIAIKITPEINA
jgi:hypothetical protein